MRENIGPFPDKKSVPITVILYGRTMNAAALLDTRSTAAEFIGDIVRAHFANDNSGLKRVARIVRRGERTAEGYWQGKSAPGVPEFLRLAQEVPELRAAVAALLQLDINRDPRALAIIDYVERVLAVKGPE